MKRIYYLFQSNILDIALERIAVNILKLLVWGSLCCPLICFAHSTHSLKQIKNNTSKADYCFGPQPLQGTARYTSPKGIGYDHGYSTLEFFLTPYKICNKRWLPFIDLRGHVFDNGRFAANAGLGLRYLAKKRIWGGNVYYDYRDTSRQHYNQIAIGLESLGKLFDYRINGYLPVGWKQSHRYNSVFNSFQGHNMLVQSKYDFALGAINAEVGAHVNSLKKVPLYFAAGPYYMSGKGATTWGGCLRASISFFSNFVRIEGNIAYDHFFKWTGQGQVGIRIPFGGKCKVRKNENQSCAQTTVISYRAMQPVERNEIIPVGKQNIIAPAINPATGLPYYFVFVNNTSSSSGTSESPYHNFAQAQANSSSNDVLYVFPGDGTTSGMDSGIILKANQKLWGSGVNHTIQTSLGGILIPAQTKTSPIITNTNVDTEGNAITLATNNSIRGFTITSVLNDAIYGTDAQNLEVSYCTFQNTTTYPIETTFSGNAAISITNNSFSNNANGVFLTLNGTSNVICSNNTFENQTSVSNVPIEITSNNNIFDIQIKNNIFNNNETGSVRFALNNTISADVLLVNNIITNNTTGSQSSLGSNVVVLSTGTINNCAISLNGNTFSENASNALYMHTSGQITTLGVTASNNTMSNNGGSALVLATPVNNLTFTATSNTLTNLSDNGIAVIASGTSTTGNITINNNIITAIGNSSNGIAVNQDFTDLNLNIANNQINDCEGTGILSYAPSGIGTFVTDISGNTISNCQNLSSNAASGLDIEQYTSLSASVTSNTLSSNSGTTVVIGSTLTAPTANLTLTGNSSTDYLLQNPGDGIFYLAPCNVDSVNVGTINTSGTIDLVQSSTTLTPCVSCSNHGPCSSLTDESK